MYPEHLASNFPTFRSWLNRHVRMLQSEGFPVCSELAELRCTPSHIALSFQSMWAFGGHYRCNPESRDSHVTFDSGLASVAADNSTVDVGILKDILLISYGKLNCVVMQGEWIKSNDQGRASVRKDRLGFWSVKFNARERNSRVNPFIFPENISQVYFMDDGVQEGWKTVLHHEPRSRRVTQEKETPEFERAGECFPLPTGTRITEDDDERADGSSEVEDTIVDAHCVRVVDAHAAEAEEDAFLDECDYEDEDGDQYAT